MLIVTLFVTRAPIIRLWQTHLEEQMRDRDFILAKGCTVCVTVSQRDNTYGNESGQVHGHPQTGEQLCWRGAGGGGGRRQVCGVIYFRLKDLAQVIGE